MATGTDALHFVDGSMDFSGGIDSVKTPTVASQIAPGGLARNQLAWLNNGGVRDGGILQRYGWKRIGQIHDGSAYYQGGMMYTPTSADPYLLLLIGGELIQFRPDFPAPVNLSAAFGLANPATPPHAFFVQAESFAIIQAGDAVTLPLFWNDTTLWRSKGITTIGVAPGTPGINEIPAAGSMDYYQGRLWYARGRRYAAGDIVGGQSGTLANQYTDSVLNVTENPLVIGGDGFTVPDSAGNIRALFHNANINSQLGEGQLFIGTRKAIYAQAVPITRNDWIQATGNNEPKQTVVQLINGPVNDRSIVKVNGDIFYQTLDPAISSLFASVRNFGQWGNRSISANEQRLLNFVDRSLMIGSSGILFNNRMLQATLPKVLPQGIVNQAVVPMDFIPVSSFNTSAAPVWEGMHEGLDVLQMFVGDFGGRERAFAVVVSRRNSAIELYEITDYLRTDENIDGEARVTWVIEFPAYTWGKEFELKKLIAAELWIDRMAGTVEFHMEWRPDSDPCWKTWKKWTSCSAKNSCENVMNPICYPLIPQCESYRSTIMLPKPPLECQSLGNRPSHIGYQFQPRLTIKGFCRIRGLLLHAEQYERPLYSQIVN